MHISCGLLCRVLGPLVILVICSGDSRSQRTDGSQYIKVTANATQPNAESRQGLTIILDIDKSCYVYANAVENEDLKLHGTRVDVLSNGKAIQLKFNYPAGREVRDDVVGTYRIYEGKVSITAVVQRTDPAEKLEVVVRMNGGFPKKGV